MELCRVKLTFNKNNFLVNLIKYDMYVILVYFNWKKVSAISLTPSKNDGFLACNEM